MLKALRDNLALLALIVIVVGTSNTEAYYGYFGLRYQHLGISAEHFLFRGISVAVSSWLVLLMYLTCIAVILLQSRLAWLLGSVGRLRWTNYGLVIVLLTTSWLVGKHTGFSGAAFDADATTSPLRRVVELSVREGQNVRSVSEDVRVLLQGGGGLYLIRPAKTQVGAIPVVRFVPESAIEHLATCTNC